MSNKRILILNGQYIPGYKGGGPIRSIANLVDNLHENFDFFVLTSDRDFGESIPYENIKYNCWQKVGPANVYYMSPKEQTLRGFYKIINSVQYDAMYLNGFFSPIFTIKVLILRKLGFIKNHKILISPRGDFSIGHLNIKKLKKYSYVYITKFIKLYSNLFWQATSELEISDIKRIYPNANVLLAPNLSKKIENKKITNINKDKKKGELRIAFISRVVKKKNLIYCLEVLNSYNFEGDIQFDIYGPKEDENYWVECENFINNTKQNIEIKYLGAIPNDKIPDTLKKYQCFFFPTLGENFGHVIVEAILSGCILLISDQTPWRNLQTYGVGWDLNLEDKQGFINAINTLINMDNNDMKLCIENIEKYALQFCKDDKTIDKNIKMLESICK